MAAQWVKRKEIRMAATMAVQWGATMVEMKADQMVVLMEHGLEMIAAAEKAAVLVVLRDKWMVEM